MPLLKTFLCFLKPIYRRNVSIAIIEPTTKYLLVPANHISIPQKRLCTNLVTSDTEKSEKRPSVLDPIEPLDLSDYGAALTPSFKFAAFVDESPLLQQLIKLGVDLNALDKLPKIQDLILRLDFERNVKPYLFFLKDCGVPEEEFGNVITKNPFIFKEVLDDLEVRINYLKSKNFDQKMISEIIVKNPKWLSVPVKNIDERLGFLQQTLELKGFQVRKMICQAPSLATIAKKKIMVNIYVLKEEMGLDQHSLKKLVLAEPSLLRRDEYDLVKTFEYLTKVMKVPLHLILKQPTILSCRKFILQERHKFLAMLGRAQYNPLLPGYVSLKNMVSTNDEEFCENIAKASIHSYNKYLKTL